MIMLREQKFTKARNNLIMAGMILIAIAVGWFTLFYKPMSTEIQTLNTAIKSDQDSIAAVERYKTQEKILRLRIETLKIEVEEWDSSFPPRKQLVSLAKQLISYFASYGIELIEMQPSLFELYALEQAGNIVAGQYVSKQLLNMALRGRYLNLGRMLDRIDQLPFKVTVTDITVNPLPNERPELEIGLDMFLYMHE